MTMHLAHPALTMQGKKKSKQKWANAEQKRQAMELQAEWDKKQKEWASMSKVKPNTNVTKLDIVKSKIPPGRESTQKYKSLDTGVTGAVSSKPPQQYTGNRVLGITIVHKSCLQPVFSQEEAIAAAQMRR